MAESILSMPKQILTVNKGYSAFGNGRLKEKCEVITEKHNPVGAFQALKPLGASPTGSKLSHYIDAIYEY